MGASRAIQALYMKVLMQRNIVAEFIERIPVLLFKHPVIAFLSHPLWRRKLEGNVCDSSLASWKTRCRLPIGYSCTFLLALAADALRQNRPLLKGWVSLGLNIRLKGYIYRQRLYIVG